MRGYTYKSRSDAWVCGKCSALVDDPVQHDDAHHELVDVLRRWSELLDRVPSTEPAEHERVAVPDLPSVRPEPVPDDSAGGPGDPLERALEATTYTTLGRSDVVGEP